MADPTHEHYAWSTRRTALAFVGLLLLPLVVVRSLAFAANVLDVQPTMAHYAFAVLPLLVAPATVLRLWSDDRFDHGRYVANSTRWRLARDLGLGVLVAFLLIPAYLAVNPIAPAPLALLYALVTGVLLGVTAIIGAAREYYDDDAHPRYFALLDRLPP